MASAVVVDKDERDNDDDADRTIVMDLPRRSDLTRSSCDALDKTIGIDALLVSAEVPTERPIFERSETLAPGAFEMVDLLD